MIPDCFYTSLWISLDCETTGLDAHKGDRPFAVSMTTFEGEDYYYRWEVDPMTREVSYLSGLLGVLALISQRHHRGLGTVFHNATFDLIMLWYASIDIGIDPVEWFPETGVWDTYIMAHAANSARETYRLKPLADQICNIPVDDQKALQSSVVQARRQGKKLGYKLAEDVAADYHLADPKLCETYAVRDTQRTMGLLKTFLPLLEVKGSGPFAKYREIVEMEHKFQKSVMQMNLTGVCVDLKKIESLKNYYQGVIAINSGELAGLGHGDFNPRSSKQKIELFYGQLGFQPEKRRRKKKDGTQRQTVSVDKKALEKFAATNRVAQLLLNISEAQHQLNSFILPFERDYVKTSSGPTLFSSFNSIGPRTGRMSSSRPNLQNITSENSPLHKTDVELLARECFVPRPGHAWLLADYSQIEVWVAAFLSDDAVMKKILLSGESIHDLTCDKVFGHKPDFATNRPMYRKLAKILTFSILYGSGPKALSQLLNVSYEEAKVYYRLFWDTYPGLRAYSDRLTNEIKKVGYITDLFGRPFFIPKDSAYKSLNYKIQGTAAGILKRAHMNLEALAERKYPNLEAIMSIHDELVLQSPREAFTDTLVSDVVSAMQGNFHELLGMPEKFKIGVSVVTENWGKKYDL